MKLRNLLAIFVTAFLFVPLFSSAKGEQCPKALQSRLVRVDDGLLGRLTLLEKELAEIHSLEQLRAYLADPKEGGADGRKHFFLLEVYGQIFRHYKKGEGIRNRLRFLVHENFKLVEDKMGDYTQRLELASAAESYGMDPLFVAELRKKADQSLLRLFEFLESKGWLGKNQKKFKELRASLKSLEWPEIPERDQKLMYRALRDMYESFNERMLEEVKPLIEEKKWSFDDNMEEGLHEARRILRWVTLAMQSLPNAFSYSKSLSAENLKLPADVAEFAREEIEKNIRNRSVLAGLKVNQEGTLVVSPEATFQISSLVFRLGRLKTKSELYFNLQSEMRAYLKAHGKLGPLTAESSKTQIQEFLIEASSKAKPSLNLTSLFVAGSSDAFQFVRQETLEVLSPFWKLQPMLEFQRAAEDAREHWDDID